MLTAGTMIGEQLDRTGLEQKANAVWRSGRFIERGINVPTIRDLEDRGCHVEWQPYEGFMQCRVLVGELDRLGALHVEFPANGTEDNRLHRHPGSARRITVISGSGWFIAKRGGQVCATPIQSGDVFMPENTLHTFASGSDGMTVESLHNAYKDVNGEEVMDMTDDEISSVDVLGLVAGSVHLPAL